MGSSSSSSNISVWPFLLLHSFPCLLLFFMHLSGQVASKRRCGQRMKSCSCWWQRCACTCCDSERTKSGPMLSAEKHSTITTPNHQRWYAKWNLSRNAYTLHARFCTFGTDLYAKSMLINKISAFAAQSEVYSECVVGWAAVQTCFWYLFSLFLSLSFYKPAQ